MENKSLWTRDFLLLCLSSFFQFMLFFILMATLPIFAIDELKGNEQQAGLVMTVFMISAVLCRPLIGKWIDEFDKKKVFIISLTLFLLSSTLYFAVSSLAFLLMLRFFHGIGFGTSTTTTATLAVSLIPNQRKGEGIGYFTMFMSLATVLGPFVGLTIIAHYSYTVLFAVCGVCALLSFVCGKFVQISTQFSTLKGEKETTFHWENFFETSAIPIGLTACLLSFSFSGISTFLSLYAKELGMLEFARYFFVVYAIAVLISRPLTGRLFDRFGANIVVYPAIFIFIVGMILLSQVHTVVELLSTAVMLGLGNGALFSTFQTLAINSSPRHRVGLATSTYFVLFDIGTGLGAYTLAMVATYTNYRTMYLMTAGIMLITVLIYRFSYQKSQNAKQEITV